MTKHEAGMALMRHFNGATVPGVKLGKADLMRAMIAPPGATIAIERPDAPQAAAPGVPHVPSFDERLARIERIMNTDSSISFEQATALLERLEK